MTRLMKKITLISLFLLVLSGCATTGSTTTRSVKASDANTQLGAAYLNQGNYVRANTKLTKAIEQDPNNAKAHSIFAILKMRLKQDDEARKAFDKALSLTPDDPTILNNYGTFLCAQGKAEEALTKFSAALKDPLYTTPEFAYSNTGICMMSLDNYDKAESYFRLALKQKKDYPAALYQMSLVNEKKNEFATAWSYLERYYKTNAPKNPSNLWTAVRLSRVLGKRTSEAKYGSLLKNRYPDAAETAQMMQRYK